MTEETSRHWHGIAEHSFTRYSNILSLQDFLCNS